MTGQWVVARTKPNRERWAAENVARQGREFYLPTVMVVRKRLAQTQPLFANYLFVLTDQWHFLLSTFGISGVVTFGESPATVSHQIIEAIKAREVNGCVTLPAPVTSERFKIGTQVRVKGGMFSGCIGVYEGANPKQREQVLLDFLGRKTSVLFAPEMLEAA
jgi:transcriptional antiterminator RfaH